MSQSATDVVSGRLGAAVRPPSDPLDDGSRQRVSFLGYGLGVLERGGLDFELGVDAQRRESPMLGGTNHGGVGRATVRW